MTIKDLMVLTITCVASSRSEPAARNKKKRERGCVFERKNRGRKRRTNITKKMGVEFVRRDITHILSPKLEHKLFEQPIN